MSAFTEKKNVHTGNSLCVSWEKTHEQHPKIKIHPLFEEQPKDTSQAIHSTPLPQNITSGVFTLVVSMTLAAGHNWKQKPCFCIINQQAFWFIWSRRFSFSPVSVLLHNWITCANSPTLSSLTYHQKDYLYILFIITISAQVSQQDRQKCKYLASYVQWARNLNQPM